MLLYISAISVSLLRHVLSVFSALSFGLYYGSTTARTVKIWECLNNNNVVLDGCASLLHERLLAERLGNCRAGAYDRTRVVKLKSPRTDSWKMPRWRGNTPRMLSQRPNPLPSSAKWTASGHNNATDFRRGCTIFMCDFRSPFHCYRRYLALSRAVSKPATTDFDRSP
jgi:hypothetical protein